MPSEAKPPSGPTGPGERFPGKDVRPTPRPIKSEGAIPWTPSPIPKRKVPEPTSDERKAKPKERELPRLTPDLLLELIGLVGGKKPALLIPADSSEPVTETEFDPDKLWQYNIAIYDRDKVFLTKKNAERDYEFPNSLASQYVLERSDAAKDPDSRMPPPEKLYGPVYVLGYDRLFEIITGLEGQLDQLKRSLKSMAPFRGSG
jgi:hypothetical protein